MGNEKVLDLLDKISEELKKLYPSREFIIDMTGEDYPDLPECTYEEGVCEYSMEVREEGAIIGYKCEYDGKCEYKKLVDIE